MALKYDSSVNDLLDRLDTLETLYREGYLQNADLKLLQGVERCIELRMKLLGYDGKTTTAAPVVTESIMSIDLTKLSDTTLKELIGI